MRVVITGANGQLGVALSQVLAGRAEVIGRDLPAFDITAADCAAQVAALTPDWVVHAAAATDVDGCEKNPTMAAVVNADGTRRIAEGCRRAGAGLVYISTDFVFDGGQAIPYVETDTPGPLSVYGRSKLAGEQAVREMAPRWAIARTAWLYGVHGRNFVKTIVTQGSGGGVAPRGGRSGRVADVRRGSRKGVGAVDDGGADGGVSLDQCRIVLLVRVHTGNPAPGRVRRDAGGTHHVPRAESARPTPCLFRAGEYGLASGRPSAPAALVGRPGGDAGGLAGGRAVRRAALPAVPPMMHVRVAG